jgi:hypothetical protein
MARLFCFSHSPHGRSGRFIRNELTSPLKADHDLQTFSPCRVEMSEKTSRNVIVSPAGPAHGPGEHTHPAGDRSQCEFCRNNRDFSMPRQLYAAIKGGDVVLFAGAGVSTEGRPVAVPSLYEQVCDKLKLDPSEGVPFPDCHDSILQ